MKFKENKEYRALVSFCRENRKTVLILGIAVLLLSAVQVAAQRQQSSIYVTGKNGTVTGLSLTDREGGQLVPLVIEAEKDGVRTKVEVILTFSEEASSAEMVKRPQSAEQLLQSELKALSQKLEEEEGSLIALPSQLDDGTRLIWSREGNSRFLLILLLFPLAVLALYQNQKEQEKAKQKKVTAEIRRELPGFNNQLLLLLNSGLIFNDAFTRIAAGYEARQRKSVLGDVVCRIRKESLETGDSLITVMGRCSKNMQVREFTRMVNVMTDNQFKGVNLTEKLESERDLLWEQRKKTAEERGKAAETKLAFPLAILLLVLILITAAPAMLQM